jgi:hypothetical protein
MLRRTTRRPGFSLTEVLVALFVMALGIISLLTLFPVGAVQMGRALQDDRTQTTCLQADAAVRMWWRQEVIEASAKYGVLNAEDAPFWVMDDPNDPWIPVAAAHPAAVTMPAAPGAYTFGVRPSAPVPNNTPRAFTPANQIVIPTTGPDSQRPSFPVMLDPIGGFSYAGDTVFWAANAYVPGTAFSIPRRSIRTAGGNLIQAIRTCTMFDDLEMSRAATPGVPAGAAETGSAFPVVRKGRYNWAAVIQRPNNSIRTVAELKILVYDRRAAGVAPPDAERHYGVPAVRPPALPVAIVNYFPPVVGQTRITLFDSIDNLKLRTNGWIMDGTIDTATGIRNANFYRIQSLTEETDGVGVTVTHVELQTPIKPPTGAPGVGAYTAQIYVLSNLIEVFDRPKLEPTTFSAQVP